MVKYFECASIKEARQLIVRAYQDGWQLIVDPFPTCVVDSTSKMQDNAYKIGFVLFHSMDDLDESM